MRLSTFSFRGKQIIISIIVSILCLAGYWAAVKHYKLSGGGVNLWQGNVIKAQKFLFDNQQWDCVIVGSSMSNNIPTNGFKQSNFNLAFAGGSAATGLKLIEMKKDKLPRVVLIEANQTLVRGVEVSLVKRIDKPHLQYFEFMREEFRPDVVFQTIQLKLRSKLRSRFEANQQPRPAPNPVDQEQPNKTALEVQQKEHSKTLDQATLENRLDELESQIKSLREKNIKVIFFEPPTHASLVDSPRTTQFRERLRERFSPTNYHWIENVQPEEYKTTDGIHLTPISADKYQKYLITQTESK